MPKIVKDIAHFFRTIKDKIIDAKLELERIMELDERPGKSSTSTSDNKTSKLKKEETPRNVSYKRTKISKKKNGKKK
jgi:Sec-independent protein translocase protein TatA